MTHDSHEHVMDLRRQLSAAKAESDALRRDATRYQWIADNFLDAMDIIDNLSWEWDPVNEAGHSFRDLLSDEIDAAMAGEKKDGG